MLATPANPLGSLIVSAGTLSLGGFSITVSGDVTGAGTIAGAGAISVGGNWDVTAVTGAPDITFAGAGTITSNGQTFGDIFVSGTYTVGGDLISGGSLDASGGNLTLDTTTGNSITGSVSNGTITVSGTTSVTVGGGWDSIISGAGLAATFTGGGTISPASGSFDTVTINASGAYSGPFTVTTELIVSGGSYTSPASHTFPMVTVNGGTFTPGSGNTVTGSLIVGTGTLALGGNTLSAGSVSQSGGTIAVAGGTISSGGAVSQNGGTISGGSLTINANGTINLNNTLNEISGTFNATTSNDDITFSNTAGYTLGTVNAGAGNVSLVNASGTVGGSGGAITADTLTLSGASTFTLTGTNDVDTLVTTTPNPASISFTDSDGIALGPINAASLTVSAGGAVTHGGAITSGTSVDITTSTGGIDLDNFTNAITGIFNASTGTSNTDITFSNTAGYTLGTVNAGAGNVSLVNASGTVGGSGGAITADTLNLGGSGAAYVLDGGNNVGTLATIALDDPDSIFFNNTNALIIGNITFKPGESFAVTAGNAITVSGRIAVTGASTSTGGTVSLQSADNTNITFNSSSQVEGIDYLSLTAGPSLSSSGEVTIDTGSFSVNNGSNTEDIHIWAYTVTWNTSGTTTPGQLHVWVDTYPSGFDNATAAEGKATHPRTPNHVVYGPSVPASLTGAFHVDSTAALGTFVSLSTEDNFNIYIVDVGNSAPANTRAVTATIGGTPAGFIEIRGVYESSGALALTPGSGGVQLADSASDSAKVTLTGTGNEFSTNGKKLTLLDANASITAMGIELGGAVDGVSSPGVNNLLLDVSGASGNTISVTGPVGGGVRLGDIEVRSINPDTSPSYGVTFSGAVTAKSYKQTGAGGTGGDGSTLFSSIQNYTGDFSFTGTDLRAYNSMTVGGDVVITNSRSFIKNTTNVISVTGSFTQNGTGPNSIGNRISALSISFNTAVLITGNATFTATATGGDITLSGPLIGTGLPDLSLVVGTGLGSDITFGDTIGSLTSAVTIAGTLYSVGNYPFGTFAVTGYNVTTSSSVPLDITATTFTVSASTNVNPPVAMTVNGNTSNEGIITAGSIAGPTDPEAEAWPIADTNYAMIFKGNYIETSPGKLNWTDPLTYVSFGPAASTSTVTFKTAPPNNGWLVFRGNATQTFDPDTLELPNVFIYHTDNNTGVTLSAVSTNQSDGRKLVVYRGKLDTSAGSWRMGAGAVLGGFSGYNGALSLYPGAELLTGNFFNENTTAHTVTHKGAGASFITASGNVELNRSLFTAAAPAVYSTLTMTGLGGQLRVLNTGTPLRPAADIGNLVINSGGTVAFSNLRIKGDVVINPGGLFVAGPAPTSDYHIQVFGNWIQAFHDALLTPIDATNPPASGDAHGSFNPRQGAVELGDYSLLGNTHAIVGNTTFYELVCYEKNAELRFSNLPHRHGVVSKLSVFPSTAPYPASFKVQSGNFGQGDMMKITRLVDAGLTPPYGSAPYDTPPMNLSDIGPLVQPYFWYFDLAPGGEMEINWLSLYYSFSSKRIPVPPPSASTDWRVDSWPYYDVETPNPSLGLPTDPSNYGSYYCVNWYVGNKFYYGFTEDSDGNGRIDRLRLQSAFELLDYYPPTDPNFPNHDALEGFAAEVWDTGGNYYTVKGYERADLPRTDPGPITPAKATKMDCLYVFLEEKPYSDGNTILHWRIVSNVKLRDLATCGILIGDPGDTDKTTIEEYPDLTGVWDTVSPRISYALTVPDSGRNEIYFQMSEPVKTLLPAIVDTVTGKTIAGVVPPAQGSEFIVQIDTPFNVSGLAPTPPDFTLQADVRDFAADAVDLRNSSAISYSYRFPPPKYPVDYTYASYVFVQNQNYSSAGSVPIPNVIRASALNHRVTDVLISVPPQKIADTRYFVWPLWARSSAVADPAFTDFATGLPGYGYGYDSHDSAAFTQTDVIWDFTGKRFLERDIITLQARDATSSSGLSLVFASGVPSFLRRAYGETNLWLPGPEPTPPLPAFVNLVPRFNSGYTSNSGVSAGIDLYNHEFPSLAENATMDFFFHLSGSPVDLYAARLDIAAGEPIPADWYNRVKPFSFGMHNITRQRGGVTILNNVINSNRREHVFLDYTLKGSGRVTIQVFTLDGNLVKVLKRESQGAGDYRVSWDGTNNGGRSVARGMYFIRVVAPDIDEIRKVMVVK
ncbi:MAG: hypothetical protein LBJ31_00415 [Treponema sp.]|nr:hypothetical protein [Treponema sp.]